MRNETLREKKLTNMREQTPNMLAERAHQAEGTEVQSHSGGGISDMFEEQERGQHCWRQTNERGISRR